MEVCRKTGAGAMRFLVTRKESPHDHADDRTERDLPARRAPGAPRHRRHPALPAPHAGRGLRHARRGAAARPRDHRGERLGLRARARRAQPARRAGAALRRRGARRRQAEPHPQRDRARRRPVDAADPRLVRRAGTLVAAQRGLLLGAARLEPRAAAAQGRGAAQGAARPRPRPGRGVGRRRRQGQAHERRLPHRRQRRHVPLAHPRPRGARERVPDRARPVRCGARPRRHALPRLGLAAGGVHAAVAEAPRRLPARRARAPRRPAAAARRGRRLRRRGGRGAASDAAVRRPRPRRAAARAQA